MVIQLPQIKQLMLVCRKLSRAIQWFAGQSRLVFMNPGVVALNVFFGRGKNINEHANFAILEYEPHPKELSQPKEPHRFNRRRQVVLFIYGAFSRETYPMTGGI